MSYSIVTLRALKREQLHDLSRTLELDILLESTAPAWDGTFEVRGIIPDDNIELARNQGVEVQITCRGALLD
ncbi:MAG: hypothetical protein ACRD96_05960 [Bryobacteraceae bacterium]